MNNERISINQDGEFEITIKSYYDNNKQNMLVLWLILWTIAGIGILSQFFFDQVEGFTTYLIVLMAFWSYFEYKIMLAFRWRKYGLERIVIKEDVVYISREIANRGIPEIYEVNWIKNLKVKEKEESNFITDISKAYWNLGEEKIIFDYKGKVIRFGMELNEHEAKKIVKQFGRKIDGLRS